MIDRVLLYSSLLRNSFSVRISQCPPPHRRRRRYAAFGTQSLVQFSVSFSVWKSFSPSESLIKFYSHSGFDHARAQHAHRTRAAHSHSPRTAFRANTNWRQISVSTQMQRANSDRIVTFTSNGMATTTTTRTTPTLTRTMVAHAMKSSNTKYVWINRKLGSRGSTPSSHRHWTIWSGQRIMCSSEIYPANGINNRFDYFIAERCASAGACVEPSSSYY